MKIKFNLYLLILRLLLSFVFFFIISLFFSQQKILLVFLAAVLFYLLKLKYQKIFVINLIILALFLKMIIYPFEKKNSIINPYKATIYEKHFLYGIKNLNFSTNILNGDLSSLNEKFKNKYVNKKPKKIKIITDNLGFRNELKLDEANYILIGDSFLHLTNLSQEKILNYVLLDKFHYKTYNAGLGATDISHYLETIKFFKENKKVNNKKFIMFVFQGNDFLSYKMNDNINYNKYIDSIILHNYFKFKTYMNFYRSSKYFLHKIKKEVNGSKKVFEYKINGKEVLFKFDYIYRNNSKINSLNNIFVSYGKYIPDLIIFIPTKHEVYCNLINKSKCINSNHFFTLKKAFALSDIEILDTTKFFRENAKHFIKTKNKLLYEIDDTHFNEFGVNVLAKFISNYISKNNF